MKIIPIHHIIIEKEIHIQKIIIEDMIHVQDHDQIHIQEKDISKNIDMQTLEKIKNIMSTTTIIIIEGINIVKGIIDIIQVEEVITDIKMKKRNQ
jgi:hypothetical protein